MKARIYFLLACIKSLSFQRLSNFVVLIISYVFSLLTKRLWYPAFPFSLSVEPCSLCNLSCPQCPTGAKSLSRPNGYLTIKDFSHLLHQVNKHILYINLQFQGEPLMNDDFPEFVKTARRKRIVVSTSTNGHFLTEKMAERIVESGLNRIIISLDGLNQNMYSAYRIGGSLQQVEQGIHYIRLARDKVKKHLPLIEIQCLILGTNENFLNEIKKQAFLLGADRVKFKKTQFYNNSFPELIPKSSTNSRYLIEDKRIIEPKIKPRRGCFRLWTTTVITWDGDLVPCCFDKNADYSFGNVNKTHYSHIIQGEKAHRFRKNVFKTAEAYPICKNCR